MYKGFTSQGGVHVPAFASFPRGVSGGRSVDQIVSVMDVMPTLLEIARVTHPGSPFKGRAVVPMQGRSLLPLLRGSVDEFHDHNYWIGWELFGKRAVRRGDWKLIYEPYDVVLEPRPDGIKTETWQLYNLSEDPNELNDVSAKYQDKFSEMKALWDRYIQQNGVVLPDKPAGY
jgi:arylsulfatase